RLPRAGRACHDDEQRCLRISQARDQVGPEHRDELVAAPAPLALVGRRQIEPGRGYGGRQSGEVGAETSGASDRGWHRLNCGRPRRLPIPGGPRPTAADPGGLAGSCRTRRRGRSPPTPRSAPSTLPRPPPLLGGEPPSPVSCREEVHFRAPVRGLHLEEVEYLEPGVSRQPEPPRNREVELDPA